MSDNHNEVIPQSPTVQKFNRVFEGLAVAADVGPGLFTVTIGDRVMLLGIRAEIIALQSLTVSTNEPTN